MSPQDCPIKKDAETIGKLSRDMVKALNKLRRDLDNCSNCTAVENTAEDCPFLREYHAAIESALVRIAEEWHLQI
jgi:hypothetical protein